MPIYLGINKNGGFIGDKRLRWAYLGDSLIYQYDIIAPTLTVASPNGVSEDEPEYISNLVNYKIYGYALDENGGKVSVYVNDNPVVYFPPAGENGHWVYNDIDLSLEEGKVYRYDIYAVDSAGNKSETVTRYLCYDTAAPVLTVINALGATSSAPAYIQSDVTYRYTFSGTVSDNAGISSIKVNGVDAIIDGTNWSAELSLAPNTTHAIKIVAIDNGGKSSTIVGYICVETYYQQAARIAGTTVQSSLTDTLSNSNVCTAIANNPTAYNIMAIHYKSEMTDYIDKKFSNELNLLNFKCRAKTYLFKNGNQCINVTGGWTADNGAIESNQIRIYGYWDQHKADTYDGYGGEAGGAYTVNKLDLTGFNKYGCTMSVKGGQYGSSSYGMGGSSYNGNSYWYADGYTTNTFLATSGDTATATYYTVETMGAGKYASVRISDPGEINGIVYAGTGYFYEIWVE